MAEYAIMAVVSANIYQPITEGNDGDTVTPTNMAIGDVHDSDIQLVWALTNTVKVSTLIDTEIPGPIEVEDTEYSIDSGKTWRWSNKFQSNFVGLTIQNLSAATQNYDKMTIGCLFVPGEDENFFNQHDAIIINGAGASPSSSFAVLQTNTVSGNFVIRAHSSVSFGSTFSDPITVVKDTRYWVNLHFDGPAGKVRVAVYDASDFTELTGSPVEANMDVGEKTFTLGFGRTDAHGDNAQTEDFSELGQIIIDTTGVFPLIPTAAPPPVAGGDNWGSGGWGA